jgi:hypothetical protein
MVEPMARRAVPHEDLLRSGSRTTDISEDCGKGPLELDSAKCTMPLNLEIRCVKEFDHKIFSARGACQSFVYMCIQFFA